MLDSNSQKKIKKALGDDYDKLIKGGEQKKTTLLDKTKFNKLPPKMISYRCYRNFNEERFRNDLKSITWRRFPQRVVKTLKTLIKPIRK